MSSTGGNSGRLLSYTGIFSDVLAADPLVDPKAKKIKRITHMEALNLRLQVMDATALSLCLENRLPIIVFDLKAPRSIERAVAGESIGTLVYAEE